MRACPYCGKDIQDEAIVCRYCGLDVDLPEWLKGKVRCHFCAEWIGPDQELCPYCKSDLTEVAEQGPAADPPPPLPSVEEDLDFLRRIVGETDVSIPESTSEPPPKSHEDPTTAPRPERPRLQPEPASAPRTEPDEPEMPSEAEMTAGEPQFQSDPEFQGRAQEPYGSSPWSDSSQEDSLRADLLDEAESEYNLVLPDSLKDLPLGRLARIAAVLVLLLAGAGGAVALARRYQGGAEPPQLAAAGSTPTATPTATPLPTDIPTATTPGATPSPTAASRQVGPCVRWDEVTLEQAGEEMCVYGSVRRWFATSELPFVAVFTEEPATFAFVDRSGPHSEVRPGDCISGSGTVEVMSATRPYIDLNGEVIACPD